MAPRAVYAAAEGSLKSAIVESMRLLLLIAAFCVASCATPSAAQQAPASAPPDWWRSHVEFVSRDGGVWVSPNPPGENDPISPMRMQWNGAPLMTATY